MVSRDKELLKKLLGTFKVEAEEHVNAISLGLIELEKTSSPEKQGEIVETVFREVHSLKGAASAVNLVQIESSCQSLESLFAQLKSRERVHSPELFDDLHQKIDALGALLSTVGSEAAQGDEIRALRPLQGTGPGRQTSENIPVATRFRDEKQGPSETLRLPAFKLDSLLRQAEELIPVKATAAQRISELRDVGLSLADWEVEWKKVRPQAHAMRALAEGGQRSNGQSRPSDGQAPITRAQIAKVSAFLDRNETARHSIQSKLAVLAKNLESDRRVLDRRVDELVEDTKRVSMVPFSALLESFPKLVRDLCRDCGKDADLRITGGEIETDRRILEEMKDPLIHLVRNCVDHGIERPKRREERGKPLRATINLAISPKSADKVEIVVSDDGAGIDVQKVHALKL